ncbi:hypothetical protein BC835DRAFT_1408167 [Cytidiella melzeri]|nr:hypothetical protein BC835DRAFT_1408167 [Cytidiella melzeri]
MAAISLAKQAYLAFNKEKPHSSITEWVELLTAPNTADEAYDGIPELVDSINIQATGPGEASRAIRKKLKHGNAHQQYRSLVILRALVENGGQRFQTTFADGHLTDAIKMLATESTTDPKVKKKLVSVLGAWHAQFKDDPSMSGVANLYNLVKPPAQQRRAAPAAPTPAPPPTGPTYDRPEDNFNFEVEERRSRDARRMEEETRKEEKRKAKEAKEAAKRKALEEEEERRRAKAAASAKGKAQPKRKPFNFEQEKPQILTAIANASTASNNLVNAITLVNTENDSLLTNERVQEYLQKAKLSRKQIVRYVQLVENEDMIGTLIETNDRIIAALETYDTLIKPTVSEQDVSDVQKNLAAVKIHDSELGKLQEKQRAAVQRSIGRGKVRAHPDLQDLSFGNIDSEQGNLPPPIRPTSARLSGSEDERGYRRGSLSDYSDYESSDEETHTRASGSGSRTRAYQNVSDDEVDVKRDTKRGLLSNTAEDDPFADPFLDQEDEGVTTPGIQERKLVW